LRDLGRGIRPAVLTEHGLGPALVDLVQRARITVRLDVEPVARFDPTVEVTAYYVVSEALQNVVKHTVDAAAQVSVVHRNGWLCVTVADDGPGGAVAESGTGLRGLVDRVAAVGGRLRMVSPPGAGTVVSAELPCAGEPEEPAPPHDFPGCAGDDRGATVLYAMD